MFVHHSNYYHVSFSPGINTGLNAESIEWDVASVQVCM